MELGAKLWPQRRGRICAVQGGGDYAAQMLLGRLRRQGLVVVINTEGSSKWRLTEKGRSEARNDSLAARDPVSSSAATPESQTGRRRAGRRPPRARSDP